MTSDLDMVYLRWCARRVLHLLEAPEVVVRWIDTGDDSILDAAREAATAAASRSTTLMEEAAARAAMEATWAETSNAPWEAAQAMAWASLDEMDWEKAYTAERYVQSIVKAEIVPTVELVEAHGIAALRAWEGTDPWLLREVWRALGRPDLAIVEDWCERLKEAA